VAALGGTVEVPTLQGTAPIKIPAGTQPDKTLRLKGLGVPSLKTHQAGDEIIRVKIQIPTKMSARQKELLVEFAKESGVSLDAEGDGFFDKMKTYFE